MSSLPQWTEVQKDDIVRCQAENKEYMDKIESLRPQSYKPEVNLAVQNLHQKRDTVLVYAKENYNIQSPKQLRDTAHEITRQRELLQELNRQFDQQPTHHERPVESRRASPEFQQSEPTHHERPESRRSFFGYSEEPGSVSGSNESATHELSNFERVQQKYQQETERQQQRGQDHEQNHGKTPER